VRLFYHWQLAKSYTRKPHTWDLACVTKCRSSAWIIGTFFGQERPTQEQLHGLSFFYPYMILACAPVLCQLYIYKNSLYIMACVAKCWSSAWIIVHFGHERPTQEQLHGRFGLFTSICILACASIVYQCQLYTRRSHRWCVWPNAGVLHKLLVNFLARKGQHKNSYVDFYFFYSYIHSGLCVWTGMELA